MAAEERPATGDGVERLTGKCLRMGVQRGTGQLVELWEAGSGQNLVNPAFGLGGLWELDVRPGEVNPLTPARARTFTSTALAGPVPAYVLSWRDFGLPHAPDLVVEVRVEFEAERPLSRWWLAVTHPGTLTILRVRFPRVLHLSALPEERLAVPFWMGLLARQPREVIAFAEGKPSRREHEHPGHLAMQCLAFYSEGGPGVYLASEDPAGRRKSFAVFSEADAGLNLEIVHLPEAAPESAAGYALPYASVLGTFRGDWFTAAQLYRSWATNQPWARESRVARGAIPRWISETGLWVWNRGRSTNVMGPALALQRAAGVPVSVFWHWWHGCAYDTGFPEYLPPREGEESFKAAVAEGRQQGIHALVYMNQRLWGMTTASWTNEHAERYAVKGMDGRVRPEVYNTFTRLPCATMCLGTEFWRAKYAGLAAAAVHTLGVGGIYMDQACSSLACFDATHSHPPGGGTYWIRGFQALVADIRQRCAAAGGVALAGEGCGENWLPHLDLMLALELSRERYAGPDGWEMIPFFSAVYHDHAIFFGNYSSLTLPPYDDLWPAEFAPPEPLQLLDRKFAQQFYLEQARAFVYGQQPTLANFKPSLLTERPEEIAFVSRLARLRRQALPWLLHGQMLPAPGLAAPQAEIAMSRLSIYAGRREGLKEFRKTVPLALATAWRAPDGRVALALASLADDALTLKPDLSALRPHLPPSGRVFRREDTGRVPIGRFTRAPAALEIPLSPRGACMIEFETERN